MDPAFRTAYFDLLSDLTRLDAPSGHEQPVARRMLELLAPHADSVHADPMGNVYAHLRGRRDGPTVMIVPHSDEIGMLVRHVEPAGFLRVTRVGGVSEVWLPGTKVRVNGHLGVVGLKPGHFQTPDDRRRVLPLEELYVDVGARSADEVAAMGIRVGDPVVARSELEWFTNADRYCGKALDNRIGCALLVLLFRAMEGRDFAGTLLGLVAVQEEVGLRGAGVGAFRARADYGLAVDTIPCGGTPDVRPAESDTDIGRGPIIPLAGQSPTGRGFLIHPGVFGMLRDLAAAEGVPIQVGTFHGTSNDSAAIALAGGGMPAASVCIPRRYSHSPVETADVADAWHCHRLLEAVVRTNGPERRFGFV